MLCEILIFVARVTYLVKQQHGFIDSVGFDLYSQMLEEAVNEKRGIKEETPDAPEVEVELNLDAYLPAEYIQNEQAKIEIYKSCVRLRQKINYLM